MERLYPDWRDFAVAAGLFVLMLVFFTVLSQLVLYPLGTEWWFAVSLALGVASIPFVFRILVILQKTRSSLDIRGFKIDFGQSLAIPAIPLTENLAEGNYPVGDSGTQKVVEVARRANESTVVVVDLKSGNGWYKTRLFALAAGGLEFGYPRIIAFVATVDGKPGSFLGFADASALARAILRDNEYSEAFQKARTKYDQLAAFADSDLKPEKVQLQPDVQLENDVYRFEGRPSLMAIIIHELLYLEPPENAGGIVWSRASAVPPLPEPWVNAADVQEMLGDALHTECIEERKKDMETIAHFLTTKADFIALVRGNRFLGLVPVTRVLREILHSLIAAEK